MKRGDGQEAIGDGQSITERVRNLAAAHNFIRKQQVIETLCLTKKQADAAFNTLRDQGFLKRVGHGTYEYMQKPMEGANSPIEDKVWRAMRISPTFSASELARVAGTTANYVYKLFRMYRPEGFIEPAGRQTGLSGFSEKKWRLTPKGRHRRQRPRLKVFKPDPLVMAVVALNKLVCTGIAIRSEEDNRKALKFCREIEDGLRDLSEEKGDTDAGDA